MQRASRSQSTHVVASVIGLTALATALVTLGCSSPADVDAANSSATLDLGFASTAEAKSNVSVLIEPRNGDRQTREFQLDASQSLTVSFDLQPGEHLVAIGCFDENGEELTGAGTAKLDVVAGDHLQLDVSVADLVANGAAGGSIDGNADGGVDGDTGSADATTSADATVDVSIDGETSDCDSECQSACDALLGELL